jgi:uncharacterized membrane protein
MKALLERPYNRTLIVVMLIGAGLRWLQIGSHSFWYDEALSSLIAGLDLSQILANAAASDHPPGYYLLLHFWLALGQSETMIRSLSALFSLGAIPLVYGLGRWLFNRSTATLAAMGMATFPFQIYFAQETRMYGVAVFLATALTWLFLYAVIGNKSSREHQHATEDENLALTPPLARLPSPNLGEGLGVRAYIQGRWLIWLGYALMATLGLYIHYFIAFLLLGLHTWVGLNWRKFRTVIWRLVLADGLVALLFLPQLGQALARTQAYLGGIAWQASPNILSPLTTIYYLLFAHRTPIWLYPISLFLTLAVLVLTVWELRRRSKLKIQVELGLWFSVLTPIVAVIIISWLLQPIYLERSFAVSSPALVLLLAHGAVAAPRGSPTPYLMALLAVPIAITLTTNVVTPDPAKPPIREAARLVAANFAPGDVNLHLQDASFMPAVWYTPDVPHVLADVPGAAWTVASTHHLFGGDIVKWPADLKDADRLWLTVMPGFTNPEQVAVHEAIEATYPQLMMQNWGEIQLYLYDLRGVKE